MAKKKTASLIGLILLAVAILGAVLSVVGVFIDLGKIHGVNVPRQQRGVLYAEKVG